MPSPLLVAYGALAAAILSEVAGSTLLKMSDGFTRLGPTLGLVVLYVLSFFLLSQALKVLPLGFAYAIWAGVGIVLTALIGLVLFRQTLDLPALAGIALIVSGVVVMNVFSRSVGH